MSVPKLPVRVPSVKRSARLFSASEGLLREVGASAYNHAPDRSLHERTAVGLRSRLGDSTLEEARDEDRAMAFEQAVAFALGETT